MRRIVIKEKRNFILLLLASGTFKWIVAAKININYTLNISAAIVSILGVILAVKVRVFYG